MENNDKEQLLEWQKTKSPELFAALYGRYQPLIGSVVSKYRTTGLAPATLRANANVQLLKAFESYDGSHNTQPITHIYNALNKVQRLASESLLSGHIPEARNMKRATFAIVKENLQDQLGREASVDELSDELAWSPRETQRMLSEEKGETTASGAAFDFYGSSTKQMPKDVELIQYMYHELNPTQKIIFEHTFPYYGKQQMNNKELAKILSTSEMAIHREKKKMSDKIKSYR